MHVIPSHVQKSHGYLGSARVIFFNLPTGVKSVKANIGICGEQELSRSGALWDVSFSVGGCSFKPIIFTATMSDNTVIEIDATEWSEFQDLVYCQDAVWVNSAYTCVPRPTPTDAPTPQPSTPTLTPAPTTSAPTTQAPTQAPTTQAPTPDTTALVPAPTPNSCSGSAGHWQHCGGTSMSVEKCCPSGWECSGEAWKECKPKPCDSSNECQCADAQCGGQAWNGRTCCEEGLTCVSSNAWYSACKWDS